MTESSSKAMNSDRRTFLKVGVGAVAGAVVVGGATAVYYNGVVGNKNSDINTLTSQLNAANASVSTLKSQLATAMSQQASLTSQLASAKSQAATLTTQLAAAKSSLTTSESSLATETNMYNAAQASITTLNSKITSLNGQLATATSNVTNLTAELATANGNATNLANQVAAAQSATVAVQTNLDTRRAFLVLNPQEVAEVQAIAESMIPDTSTNPGANAAGVAYFIDNQLQGVYGFNAKFYMQGPFQAPNQSTLNQTVSNPSPLPATTLSVRASNGEMITYTGGTPVEVLGQPYYYQHPFQMRQFWETGLNAFEVYCNAAYGGNFETLSAANQASAIADLWAGKPTGATWATSMGVPTAAGSTAPTIQSLTNFGPSPQEWVSEVQEMVWAGFVTDPIHGGNENMVSWKYFAYNGVNEGNFYGEGYTTKQLMVSQTHVVLQPASLGQLQKGSA